MAALHDRIVWTVRKDSCVAQAALRVHPHGTEFRLVYKGDMLWSELWLHGHDPAALDTAIADVLRLWVAKGWQRFEWRANASRLPGRCQPHDGQRRATQPMVAPMWPEEFPTDEIHVRHNGTVWVVRSHFDVPQHFSTLADAKQYANNIRDRLIEKPRVILHRADSPLAE